MTQIAIDCSIHIAKPMGIQLATLLNQIPLKADALFWLDGVIIEDGGNNYFRDKTGNGRKFLITGYDFDSTWVAGMPYKTAATISAPAGDTTLIAADINNYLYDSGGTPNQIPVVSLFQDVDYEHKLFCRHIAQVVDGNGVETSEARVVDIALYNTVKSAIDLTLCQNYFAVPIEVTSNVKWVSKNGNDTTGNGTKALPWKTFAKADSSATANDTIYIKTGIYDESSGALPGTFYATKALKYNAIGGVVMTSTGANYVMYTAGAVTYEFKGIVFDAELEKNIGVNCYTPNISNSTYERCLIKRFNDTSFGGVVTHTTLFKNCITIGTTAKTTQKYVVGINQFDNCLINNTTVWAYANNIFKNVKESENKYTVCDIRKEITIVGGKYNHAGLGFSDANSSIASNINCQYALFTHHDIVGITPKSIDCSKNSNTSAIIKYCNFSSTVNKENGRFVIVTGNCEISNNNTYDNVSAGFYHIQASDGIVKMNYNRCQSNSLSGTTLSIGGETSVSNLNNNSEFIGNRVIGFKLDNPSTVTATTHSVLITSGINIKIAYNKISHTTLGMVVKTNAQAYSGEGVYGNLFENCRIAIYVRGITGMNVFNNTIKHSNTVYGQAFSSSILVDENTAIAGDQFSENIIIKNNILDVKVNVGNLIQFDAHAAANGCIAENNQLFGGKYLLSDGTSYSDLATAQAAGKLLNCVVADSQLDSNLIPITKISGVDLGATYDDGLDVSTNWGSTTTLPIIVTKQQTATWQKGAYVQD